ncbi:hypothetical protein ANN_25618 [Periplaneta americana]|uniref:Uncharacterized protein n=1 Tax=Periplaneta americana TaxID=6978 RepID=A0ABQ8S1G4_PERAM|nr:hypothetical protein ANN_25618 [Periplaneta americana]
MAGLCEGGNEPPGSLKASNAWKLWTHGKGKEGGGVKLTRKASETRLAAPGEEVASPIVLVSCFGLAAPGEEMTSPIVLVSGFALAAPGEEVTSPIVLVSGFALAAPGEEVTSLTIACMSMRAKFKKKFEPLNRDCQKLWTFLVISGNMAGFVMCVHGVKHDLSINPGQVVSHMFSSPANFITSLVDILMLSTVKRKDTQRLVVKLCDIDELLLREVSNTYFAFIEMFTDDKFIEHTVRNVEYYLATHLCWVVLSIGKATAISASCHFVTEESKTLVHNLQKLQLMYPARTDMLQNLQYFSNQCIWTKFHTHALFDSMLPNTKHLPAKQLKKPEEARTLLVLRMADTKSKLIN